MRMDGRTWNQERPANSRRRKRRAVEHANRNILNIGLRGHNNVCIMAEGEPVPYDPTLIGLSETSTAFTCAETHAPVCNGRTPAFYLPQLLW